MTTTPTISVEAAPSATPVGRAELVRTARQTGWLYVALGVTGMLGFLLIRPALFVADDPAATVANLVDRELLARAGVALEMGIVASQALVALWFYRLFRSVDAFAAGAIAVFGLVNAIVILGSAAFLATALDVAIGGGGAGGAAGAGDAAATVQLMYGISENLWGVGAVSFGLWLLPMGWCVLRSGWMPRGLGYALLVGGAGYVLSAVTGYLAPEVPVVKDLLTVPATIGEFWMIGYLLWRGVRRGTATA